MAWRRESRVRGSCDSESLRKTFSTTITAPSTMMPKSIAPRESRFAGIPRQVSPRNVANSDNERRAKISQEQEQYQGDQRCAFGEILEDGMQGGLNKPGAVVERHDLY